jgi:mono/diheme cytochrome c family protein
MKDSQTIKRKMRSLPYIVILLLILSGCYYDNEECLYPEGTVPCDTANVTFTGTIWPVINDNCVVCHSGGTPSGNVSLESYDDIRAAALITPGNYGSLYGVMSHAPGNSPMPKNGNKLSDCILRQVEIWIEEGAPNN